MVLTGKCTVATREAQKKHLETTLLSKVISRLFIDLFMNKTLAVRVLPLFLEYFGFFAPNYTYSQLQFKLNSLQSFQSHIVTLLAL